MARSGRESSTLIVHEGYEVASVDSNNSMIAWQAAIATAAYRLPARPTSHRRASEVDDASACVGGHDAMRTSAKGVGSNGMVCGIQNDLGMDAHTRGPKIEVGDSARQGTGRR